MSAAREEIEANAALIAAAPDLLEACKEALSFSETLNGGPFSEGLPSETESHLRAAIAKAEGKP